MPGYHDVAAGLELQLSSAGGWQARRRHFGGGLLELFAHSALGQGENHPRPPHHHHSLISVEEEEEEEDKDKEKDDRGKDQHKGKENNGGQRKHQC